MNTIARTGVIAVAALAAGTLVACHHAKTASDAQLTRLLRNERAQPNDPRAPLDAGAVGCLRAWSGDAELAKPLSPAAVGDAAKSACRSKLDGWIADATRNPDKFAFEDITAPPTVRQAIALLAQNHPAGPLPMVTDQPPPAMFRRQPPAPAVALPKGPVDVSEATAGVKELDGLCTQAKDAAASGSTAPLARYAWMCEHRIAQLRDRIGQLSRNGGTSREAEILNDNVRRMLVFGRGLAAAKAPAAPPKSPQH